MKNMVGFFVKVCLSALTFSLCAPAVLRDNVFFVKPREYESDYKVLMKDVVVAACRDLSLSTIRNFFVSLCDHVKIENIAQIVILSPDGNSYHITLPEKRENILKTLELIASLIIFLKVDSDYVRVASRDVLVEMH